MVLDAGDLAKRNASVAAAYHQLSPAAITVTGSAPARAAVLGIALQNLKRAGVLSLSRRAWIDDTWRSAGVASLRSPFDEIVAQTVNIQ